MSDVWAWITSVYQGPFGVPVKVVSIIAVAILARLLLQILIRRTVSRVVRGVKKRHDLADTAALQASPVAALRVVQRTRALGGVLSTAVSAVVVIVALVLIVSAIDPNATGAFSLITAALGAGLGFGAQNVVRDALAGLFMVSEDQLGVGDVVDLGLATGVVEAVGIRITTVRDANGALWSVRNGEIARVGNMSQGWANVIIDLAVPYDADIPALTQELLATATEMRAETRWKGLMLAAPEVPGIESISAEATVIQLVVKTRAGAKDAVARELRARVRAALDANGLRLASLVTGAQAPAPRVGGGDAPVIPGVVKPATGAKK